MGTRTKSSNPDRLQLQPNLSADTSSLPMVNALEGIRANPVARQFDIGDLLFAQFACPGNIGIWTQTDHLIHVLTGNSTWKTASRTWSIGAGEAVYVKKGAYVLPEHLDDDYCVQVFFIPDSFIKATVIELAPALRDVLQPVDSNDLLIRINSDTGLSAFFSAMSIYFAGDEDPPAALLRLKLRELLTTILVGQGNPLLSTYLRQVAASASPSVAAIMEMNFYHNLPLAAFAKMCHRSLSSFKRDFRKLYGVSPGKWLLGKRLERAASLLHTSDLTVTEVVFECGFEDLSHFSRAFKERFDHSPSAYRQASRSRAVAARMDR